MAASNARFVAAHVKIGISQDGGISAFLGRALPPQALNEILLEGGIVGTERLSRWGIVNRRCDREEALATALT